MKLFKILGVVILMSSLGIASASAADPNNRKEGAAWADLVAKKQAIKDQNKLYEAARNADPASGYRARSKAAKDAGAAGRAANRAQKDAIQAANIARGRPAGNS